MRPCAPAHMPARFAGRQRVRTIAGRSEGHHTFQPPDDRLRGLAALAQRSPVNLPAYAPRLLIAAAPQAVQIPPHEACRFSIEA
jgi:hypothetical protein